MKIAFFSNYMNHHQLPFSNALIELAESYHFVATKPIPEKKLKFGYADMNNLPFIVRAYEPNLHNRVNDLLTESDVVIFGDGIDNYIPQRMQHDKLSFLFSERFFKKGWWQRFKPTTRKRIARKTSAFNGKNYHLLCAGAYVAGDARSTGFKNNCYRWGYLPEVEKYDADHLLGKKQSQACVKLLWVGRFLPWKRPQDAIALANQLKILNLPFELEMVGAGKVEPKLRKLIDRYDLKKHVKLTGSVTPGQVREKMKQASIFLMTSDFHEGWGAVINEAMNSCCCVIASRAAGSVPTLIEHQQNGLIFEPGKISQLCKLTEDAIRSEMLRETLGRNAYHTMTDLWNAPVAAKRLVELSESLLTGEDFKLPACGPISKALEL